jgi:hypothetical protein
VNGGVAIYVHRPKLKEAEQLPLLPHPHLPKYNGSFGVQPDYQSYQHEDRCQQAEKQNTADNVDNPLQ